jgi:hypothetical protein
MTRLDGCGLHRLYADHGLDEELLRKRAAVELLFDRLAQSRPDQRGDGDIAGDRGQHDHRQLPRIDEEHGDEDEGEQKVERREQALAGEKVADVLQLTDARHGLAGGAGFEIAERQAQQVMEQPLAQLHVDAVGRMRQRIGAQILQHHVEQAENDEPGEDDIERVVALVLQHLVDDDLEKQRRHQREDLHEQRGDQHVRQRLAIAPDRRHEPLEAERARIGARSAPFARDEDGALFDPVENFVGRSLLVTARYRIDEAEAAVRGLPAENEIAAVPRLHEGGSRDLLQPFEVRDGDRPGPYADEVGGAQDVALFGLVFAQRQLAANGDGVGGNTVETGYACQRSQAIVELRLGRLRPLLVGCIGRRCVVHKE